MYGVLGLPPGRSARLCAGGDPTSIQAFASALGFGGTQDTLIENLIGYTLTERVQINTTKEAFEKIRLQSKVMNKSSDPALISLLEGQAALIKSLTEKLNSLSEAPTRPENAVPPLCPKELHDLALIWNHPQWVTRVLYYLKCAILKEALPLDAMRIPPSGMMRHRSRFFLASQTIKRRIQQYGMRWWGLEVQEGMPPWMEAQAPSPPGVVPE